MHFLTKLFKREVAVPSNVGANGILHARGRGAYAWQTVINVNKFSDSRAHKIRDRHAPAPAHKAIQSARGKRTCSRTTTDDAVGCRRRVVQFCSSHSVRTIWATTADRDSDTHTHKHTHAVRACNEVVNEHRLVVADRGIGGGCDGCSGAT